MQYTKTYSCPLGKILLASNEEGLLGLWFEGQKYFARGLDCACENLLSVQENTERTKKARQNESAFFALQEATKWLDIYFEGNKPPDFFPPLSPRGSDFQKAVWNILLTIPYSKTISYYDVAKILAQKAGKNKMSSLAVGQAVAHNPISIIIPCHRVIAKNGDLKGYAGGLEKKKWLLSWENHVSLETGGLTYILQNTIIY